MARLRRQTGLVGWQRRRASTTTRRDLTTEPAPDRGQQTCAAPGPDHLWVADLTSVPTREGVMYVAVVLDVFSRRVGGWAMAGHMRTQLVLNALGMALAQRRPSEGRIHHSDRGSQYTSRAFADRCQAAGIRRSMGAVGGCFDNALAESFFAPLACELLALHMFRTHAEARTALFTYIEGFYNRRRRHSALGYLSPETYDRGYTQQQAVA